MTRAEISGLAAKCIAWSIVAMLVAAIAADRHAYWFAGAMMVLVGLGALGAYLCWHEYKAAPPDEKKPRNWQR